MQLKYQLFRNSITTMIQVVVNTAVGLVLPALLLRRLGLYTYGVWALIILVGTYTALLDFGFGSGLVKLIAEAAVWSDDKRVQRLVNTSIWFYALVALVSSALVFLGGKVIAALLLKDATDAMVYLRVLQGYTITALAGLPVIPFSALLRGFQRYDQTNLIEMIASVLNAIVSVGLVVAGMGLWGLVLGAGTASLWRLVVYIIVARQSCPNLGLHWIDRESVRVLQQLLRLSPADLSVRIYGVVTQSVIRLTIGAFLGVSFVGLYDIAKRVVSQVNGMSTVVFVPLMPAVSALAAQGRKDRLHELLLRCFTYLSMIGLPLACFLFVFFDPLIQVWLRVADTNFIALAGRLLLIATFAELYTGPVTTSALGLGTPNLQVLKMLVTCVLVVILTQVMGRHWGFAGIVGGEMIAILFGTIVALILFQKWFDIPVVSMVTTSVVRVLVATLPVWLAFMVIRLLLPGFFIWNTILGWGGVLVSGLAVTGLVYWYVGLISIYELDLVRTSLQLRSAKTR